MEFGQKNFLSNWFIWFHEFFCPGLFNFLVHYEIFHIPTTNISPYLLVFLGLNNGKDITDEGRSASEDREDEALASDADISDTEDNTSEIKQVANPNDEDSIAAEDN